MWNGTAWRGNFCLTKVYKFLPKYPNSLPKCDNFSPWQEKCQSNALPGVVGEKKLIFLKQGIFARPPCPNLSRQAVSREKKLWLTKIVTVWPEDQPAFGKRVWMPTCTR